MPRSIRFSALVYIAIFSTAAAAIAMGCAASSEVDEDLSGADASTESGRDARTSDGRPSGDGDDDPSNENEDAGKKDAGDPGTDDDGGPDAGSDASDGGPDAGDDAGSDAGGADGGDSGTWGGDDAGDGGTAVKPVQGEVVISEVLYDPSSSDTDGEWIEIHNTAATPRLLSGLVLKDGASPARSHTIRPGLVIAPGAYVLLVSDEAGAIAAKVPAAAIVYEYNKGLNASSRIALGNSDSGSIVLLDGSTEIARAKYGPAPPNGLGLGDNAHEGIAIQLKTLTYAGAGLKANWCYSATPWTAGSDRGTPGAASDCP
jgi:Lamin Tail Domain